MIESYTHPGDREDRLEEIELEILHLDKLHLDTTRYLEKIKIPNINNADVKSELVDLFHNVQFQLNPILDAISTLKVEKGLIYDELDDDPSDFDQHNIWNHNQLGLKT